MKVPVPIKTGNKVVDSDNTARRECLMNIIDTLVDNPVHIWHMYTDLQKRLRDDLRQLSEVSADKFGSMSTFGKLDEQFLTDHVLTYSDLCLSDIVKAKQCDDRAVYQLAQFSLQWPASLRFPDEMQVKEVAKRVCALRARNRLNSPLKDFKAKGGIIAATGALHWLQGSYMLQFGDGLLNKITHFSGAVCDVPATHHITTDYTLHFNWDEANAQLQKPPLPPIVLMSFFKAAKSGPFARPRVMTSCKEFQQHVKDIFKDWDLDRQRVNSTASGTSVLIQQELKQVDQNKRRASMAKARVSAEEKLKDTKKRRTIDLHAFAGAVSKK